MEEVTSEMNLLFHLDELRRRLLFVLIALVVAMGVGLFVAPYMFAFVKSEPYAAGLTWNVFSPWDGAKIYMSAAFLFAVGVTLPFTLYQLWAFVKTGLKPDEREASVLYIPAVIASFLIGLAFSYYVVFPMSISFATRITDNLQLVETYGVTQFFSFMFSIILPVTLAFELPLVVMFLTRIGIVNPVMMGKLRKHAYLVLVVLASIISPPELISHLMVFIPLVVLYEISILLARFVYRRKMNAAVMQS